MTDTPNIGLKKYAGTDPINLLTGYNASMDTLDTVIKQAQDDIDALEGGAFVPSANDPALDVTKLATAKVTANGIVYIPASS